MEVLSNDLTTWHITFGTYGTRLQGGNRPTVERDRSELGDPFVLDDPVRENMHRSHMPTAPVHLTPPQQRYVQELVPKLCERGGWTFRMCSADHDHVHVQLDIDRNVHGKQVRELIKRWLTQALNAEFGRRESGRWWAKAGSTRAVQDVNYLNNTFDYIKRQRA